MQLKCGTVEDLCKHICDEKTVWLNPHGTIWSIQHAVDGEMFNPRSHDNEIHIQVYEENNLRDVYLAIKICQGDFFLSACVTSTTKLGLFDNITRCQTIAFYLVIFTSTVLFGLVWVCFIGNSAIWVRSSCCSNSFSMFKNKESCSTHTKKTYKLISSRIRRNAKFHKHDNDSFVNTSSDDDEDWGLFLLTTSHRLALPWLPAQLFLFSFSLVSLLCVVVGSIHWLLITSNVVCSVRCMSIFGFPLLFASLALPDTFAMHFQNLDHQTSCLSDKSRKNLVNYQTYIKRLNIDSTHSSLSSSIHARVLNVTPITRHEIAWFQSNLHWSEANCEPKTSRFSTPENYCFFQRS